MAKILLVDDDPAVVTTLECLVQGEGYEVISMTDSQEAYDRLKAGEVFDLMITDLRMAPVDGVKLITVALEKISTLPIIVISAYLDDYTIERIRDLGCKAYLDKPFNVEDVTNLLKMLLGVST